MTRRRIALVGILAVLLGIAVWLGGRALRGGGAGGPSAVDGPHTSPVDRARALRARPGTRDVGTFRLEGQVIDRDDRPVAGASVGIDTKPPRVIETEADGSFVFEGIPGGIYRVGASKDDLRADAVSVRVGPTTEPLTLRLRRGNALLVRVQDDDGAPIAGARVYRHGIIERDQRTGADGTTLLRGLSAAWERVMIEAEGFAPGWIGTPMPKRSELPIERVVILRRGAPVRGVVLDPDGAPIEGARIAIGQSELHVVSAADGSWEMMVSAGSRTFVATADGYAAGSSGPHELDGLTPMDGVVLELGRGLVVHGMVVDEDGAPAGGAKVACAIGYTSRHVWADEDGRFALTGLRDGVHAIAAFDGERGSEVVRVEAAEQTSDLRLVVVDTIIRGVVVDEADEPVAGVEIWAMGGDVGSMIDGDDHATTSSSGEFVIGPLVPGRYRLTPAYPGGHATRLFSPEVEARTGDRDVRVVLPSAGGVRGRVTRAGRVVPSFVVAVDDFKRPDYRNAEVFANPDGAFEIGPLAPGTYHLAIAGDGFPRHTLWKLRVETGQMLDLGAIDVPDGRTVRGRVVMSTGQPVAGAHVEAGPDLDRGLPGFHDLPFERALEGVRVATTGGDGTFTIEHLSEERERRVELEIAAEHPIHGRSETSLVPDGDATVELVLAGVGEIRGSIPGLRSHEKVLVRVEVQATKSQAASAAPDAAGRFQVKGLAPGTYRVVATMMTRPPQMTTVEATTQVRSGEASVVELAFGAVTLRIEGADPECFLMLVRGDAFDVANLVSSIHCDEHGSSEIERLEPGEYALCAGMSCKAFTITESPETQTFRWE